MELRKVQEMGGGTYLISLPKEWARKNMVKKGSFLTVDMTKNGYLIIYPFQKEERSINEIVTRYPAEKIEYMINEITGGYLLGYDVIKVQGKDQITYDDRGKIKKAVEQLIGLEIVEEDAQSITTQFLLEPTFFTPDKVFRRMHTISRGMCNDAIISLVKRDKYLVKVVAERDDEVDRLHFFLVRLIRSALLDPKLLSNFKLNPIDCLDYRVASSLLETIGDCSIKIVKNVSKLPRFDFSDELNNMFKEVKETLKKMQDLAVKAFLTKSINDARQVMELYNTLSRRLDDYEKVIPSKPLSIFMGLSVIFLSIIEICRCNADIADLAVPMCSNIR